MTTQLSPLTVQRFVDNNGNALAGGQLYTYKAGTSTPLATYTDSTGGTPNANPVVMNARGEANVWTSGGLAYKFVLKDSSGNLIWSVDNVTDGSVNSALAADLANTTDPTKGVTLVAQATKYVDLITQVNATGLPDGIVIIAKGRSAVGDGGGGIFRYISASVQTVDGGTVFAPSVGAGRLFRDGWTVLGFKGAVNVLWFGAAGDGVTDDSPAFQSAINCALSAGGALYVPAVSAFYLIANQLNINYNAADQGGIRIFGESPGAYYGTGGGSIINYTGAGGNAFSIVGQGVGVGGVNSGSPMSVEIDGITCNGNATCAGAVNIVRASFIRVTRCNFIGFSLASGGVITLNATGAANAFCGEVTIRDCHFSSSGRCVVLTGDSGGVDNVVRVTDCTMLDQLYGVTSDFGAAVPGTTNIQINGNHFEGTTYQDVYSQGAATGWVVSDNYFEQNNGANNLARVHFDGANNQGISVNGNTFSKSLAAAGTALVYAINANGIQVTENATAYGGSTDRFCVDLVVCTNAIAEVMQPPSGVAYPVRMNNFVISSGKVNDQFMLPIPTGAGRFVGISSGDGYPGGTVCTINSEYARNNANIRVNFNATITTKSGAGTSVLIGVLPYSNNGQDLYFPVYTANVTGTGPFYGVLPSGGVTATVYDGAGVAVNYQTACSVGSVFRAKFDYTTQG